MTGIQYRNRPELQKLSPKLAEALDDLLNGINTIATQTTASAQGKTDPPPQVTSISVMAANGVFDVAITDSNPVYRQITYFLEYSMQQAFTSPTVIHLGPSRNWRGFLGAQTLYWRAYSQYPTSEASAAVFYGPQANPTAVLGGGTATGPNIQSSKGSGTASGDGTQGGQGFGNQLSRGGQAGQRPKTAPTK